MTAIADGTDRKESPRPTALVRAAVEALATQFFEPLAVCDLLGDAWAGATAVLVGAGGSFVPPVPEYPSDPAAAYALHDQTFPKLEQLAISRVQAWTILKAASELADVRVLALRPSHPGGVGEPAPAHPHLFRHARVRQIVPRHTEFAACSTSGRLESVANGLPDCRR